MIHVVRLLAVLAVVFAPGFAVSQTSDGTEDPDQSETAEGLLTQAELENLVAPVALYPDTLLIQILVAATSPMEVIKGDRLLTVNEGEDTEVIKAAVEAEGWDESVEVLTIAFPEVIQDMALHIEWTETMGNAMLAQSDDVMAAVQTMRTQAINSGALVSTEEQTVEVTQDEDVIIQPADPEVVYVPQYEPETVYVQDSGTDVGDVLTTGLLVFGTVAVIDEIFDDDDDWNDYWGCRNCGGWGGGPIYRNPDIDIDVDGNVNIGNEIDLGDRGDRRPDGGWKPNDGKRDEARKKIEDRKGTDGKTKLPVSKQDSRADDLRSKLSKESGAPDISRPGANVKPEAVRKTMGDRPKAGNLPSVPKPKAAAKKTPVKKATKPSVKKPSASKQHVKKATAPKKKSSPKAMKKKSSGKKARSASSRGKKAGAKGKRRG